MQSAAEYALENVSATAKQRHLPLTDFYANMLRYSHDVTGGTQTPILFRSGHAGTIKDTASTSWQEASLVHVAFRNMDRTLPDKIQTANRTVHFVSTSVTMAQDDRPVPGGTADAYHLMLCPLSAYRQESKVKQTVKLWRLTSLKRIPGSYFGSFAMHWQFAK